MSDNEQKSMTPELRNRIVGSVILLIAAIVILPSVIGTGQVSLKDDFKKVPAKPEFEVVSNEKPFPQAAFEKNMPAKKAPVDEQPLDEVAATAINSDTTTSNSANNDEPVAKAVETETLTVTPMNKPKSFSTPEQLAAKQKQADARTAENSENVVRNVGASTTSNKPSPFTTQAWVIQLGSFGNKANANAIEKKLNDAGFTTFSRQINSTRGSLTKVYVGPELDKKVLQKSLSRVNKVARVNGLVTSFTIRR